MGQLDSYQKVRDWLLTMQGIEREDYDIDEEEKDEEVDEFLGPIEWPIFEKHGLDPDFSTQAGHGGVFIRDNKGKEAYVDYEEYSAKERELIVDSETEEEFLTKFEDYVLNIWDNK